MAFSKTGDQSSQKLITESQESSPNILKLKVTGVIDKMELPSGVKIESSTQSDKKYYQQFNENSNDNKKTVRDLLNENSDEDHLRMSPTQEIRKALQASPKQQISPLRNMGLFKESIQTDDVAVMQIDIRDQIRRSIKQSPELAMHYCRKVNFTNQSPAGQRKNQKNKNICVSDSLLVALSKIKLKQPQLRSQTLNHRLEESHPIQIYKSRNNSKPHKFLVKQNEEVNKLASKLAHSRSQNFFLHRKVLAQEIQIEHLHKDLLFQIKSNDKKDNQKKINAQDPSQNSVVFNQKEVDFIKAEVERMKTESEVYKNELSHAVGDKVKVEIQLTQCSQVVDELKKQRDEWRMKYQQEQWKVHCLKKQVETIYLDPLSIKKKKK